MLGSLFTGISGLSVNARNMQVIGDNIANVNTTAFKSNRSIFGNIMTQSLEGGEFRKLGIGRGVQTLATDQIWTQGSIETTSKSTDLAINGKGFFIVHEVTPEGVTEVKYTRAGAFNFDADGYMVNPDGLILAGYQVDPETGVVGNDVVDISLPAGTAPPRETNWLNTNINLNADAVPITASTITINSTQADSDLYFTADTEGSIGNDITVTMVDPGGASQPLAISVSGSDITVSLATDASGNITSTATQIAAAINADAAASALVDVVAEGTGGGVVDAQGQTSLSGGTNAETYSTLVTLYDSLGSSVPLTITFTRATTGWDWATSVPSSVSTDAIVNGSGSISFDEDGNLVSPNANPEITITNLTNGSEDLDFEWRLLDNTGITNGTLTGFASPSTTTFQSQDGFAAGTVQSVSIDELGVISGVYSNGRMVPLYHIAMADFPSYTGLDNLGNNLYAESIASGQPSIGTPGTGTLGRISPNALEMSNVDLSDQFVKMITTQRAFQANARVITTSDEVLTELVNLKR